jgi:hypothetical protein
MLWPYLSLGLATAGILALGVLSLRVYAEVSALARQLGKSSDDLARAAERLQRAAEPLARRSGDIPVAEVP